MKIINNRWAQYLKVSNNNVIKQSNTHPVLPTIIDLKPHSINK